MRIRLAITALKYIALIFITISIQARIIKAQNIQKRGFLQQSHIMTERWELDSASNKGLFLITPYKPVYITAGRWSSNPNTKPTSENPLYTLPNHIKYNNYEAKFQFSFKTKIARKLFWGHADLWIAYTQKAHWQVYNKNLSRPFRELNYEPEVILNLPVNYKLFGFEGRMLGLIMNHQSNGRSLPISRSWNRIMLQAGFERNNWQLMLRPWIRLKDSEDENPAILDYTGRCEAVVVYNPGRHQFSSIVTHSLKFKNGGKGSIQLNWVFPVIDNLRAQVQFSDGYGETLQDYNHRQTTLGLSMALVDW